MLNNVSQFDSIVTGFNSQESFSGVLSLAAGDKLDFVVGENGSFFGDTTELRATLEPVPPPAAVWFLATALAGLGKVRRRVA